MGAGPEPAPRWMVAAIGGITVAITAVVATGARVSLWDDEAATASEATRSPSELWHLLSHSEGGLAGYVLAMRAWAALAGTSELALRLPSLVAFAVVVAGTGWLVWRIAGAPAAVVAAVAIAAHPTLGPVYGIEARPYAVSTALVVLAAIAAHRASRGVGRRPYLSWSLLAAAAVACHVFAVLALAPQVLWLLPERRGTRRRAFVAALALPAAVALWMTWLASRATVLQSWIDPVTVRSALRISRAVLATGAFAALAAAVPGLWLWRRHTAQHPTERAAPADPVDLAVLLAWAAFPLAALILFSWIDTPTLVPRYALSSAVPMAALVGVAVCRSVAGIRLRARTVAAWACIAALLVGVVTSGFLYRRAGALRSTDKPTDLEAAATWVLDHAAAGDGILYAPTWAEMGMRWYLVDASARNAPFDLTARDAPSAASAGSLFTPNVDEAVARQRLAAMTRVWIAGYGNTTPWEPVPEVGIPLAMLVRRCWTRHDHEYFGITVELWLRPATVAPGCP